MLKFSNQLSFRSIYQQIVLESFPKHKICKLKLPFSQPILFLGDPRTTGRVHGDSVTVYQNILNVYTRVHVYTLQP